MSELEYLPTEDLAEFELILMSEQSLSLDQQRRMVAEIRRQERSIVRVGLALDRAHNQLDQNRREYQVVVEQLHELQGHGIDQRAA